MAKIKHVTVVAPRKMPQQERSRQTYQLILRGAMDVLRRFGVQKFSTNKVAEVSSVSIGSLYQYFPSKEAIIAALLDQCFEKEIEGVKTLLVSLSPEVGALSVLKQIFKHYYLVSEDELSFRRVIIEAVTVVGKNSDAIKFHRAVAEIIVEYMQNHFGGQQDESYQETRVFILQYVLRVGYLSSVDPEVDKYRTKELMEELAQAVLGFLKIPVPSSNPALTP